MTWGRKEILGIFGIGEDMVQEVVSLFRGPSRISQYSRHI